MESGEVVDEGSVEAGEILADGVLDARPCGFRGLEDAVDGLDRLGVGFDIDVEVLLVSPLDWGASPSLFEDDIVNTLDTPIFVNETAWKLWIHGHTEYCPLDVQEPNSDFIPTPYTCNDTHDVPVLREDCGRREADWLGVESLRGSKLRGLECVIGSVDWEGSHGGEFGRCCATRQITFDAQSLAAS